MELVNLAKRYCEAEDERETHGRELLARLPSLTKRGWLDGDLAPAAIEDASKCASDDEAATVLLAATKDAGQPAVVRRDGWPDAGREPRKWLVEGWLPAGRVAMLTGTGGAGKSRLALQLAASMAANVRDWLPNSNAPLTIKAPTPAVFASWEDEADEVGRKLRGLGVAASVGDRLHYAAPSGALWEPSGEYKSTSSLGELAPAGTWLRNYCVEHGARLLVVDPRAAAFMSNENDRALVRRFMADWDAWAVGADCAVLLVTHPPKANARYSGSTDWQAAARTVWELGLEDSKSKTTAEDSESKTTKLRCAKASYAAPPKELRLESKYPRWLASNGEDAPYTDEERP